MRRAFVFTAVVLLTAVSFFSQTQNEIPVTEGSLFAVSKKGAELGSCPLVRTDVTVDITGPVARTNVKQQFRNSFKESIEAVYVFPLSNNGAVDDFTMTIGERVIRGQIMRSEEARQIYEKAKSDGKTASLLEQQRPNIFSQSVANIPPDGTVEIEISYIEILKYDSGAYEYVFPMTVGPRYEPSEKLPAPSLARFPVYPETRSGANITIAVRLNTGVPIEKVESKLHDIVTSDEIATGCLVTLASGATIPNKDFVLRFEVGAGQITDALITHRPNDEDGYFMLILQPPDAPRVEDITPKEIVFVLDTSGSMSGFPIETAKATIRKSLTGLNPNDRFNIITFAGETAILFDSPVPATSENLDLADKFVEKRSGGGGTEMMKAVRAAFAPSESKSHLRVVCFLTDGYVGNESDILAEIKSRRNARVFGMGIGTSVNRHLLDDMAVEGDGDVDYVLSEEQSGDAAKRFFERVRSPLLTDISIDWRNFVVNEVSPSRVRDLFSSRPIVLTGRFKQPASGNAFVNATLAGVEYRRGVPLIFPEREQSNSAVATLWARRKIASLSSEMLSTVNEAERTKFKEQIIELSLKYRVLTEYTAFVAVEETIVNQNGKPLRVNVPVQIPEGVRAAQSRPTTLPRSVNFTSILSANKSGAGSGSGAGTGNISGFALKTSNLQLVVPAPGLTAAKTETQAKSGGTVEEIVKRLEDYQKSLTSVRASVQSVAKQKDGTSVLSEGTLIFSKPNSLRIDWFKPQNEVVSVANRKFLTYRQDSKEAFIVSVGESYLHELALGFATGKDLAKNYEISLTGTETLPNGLVGAHLILKPKASGEYRTIDLWVDDSGAVIKFAAFRTNGSSIEASFMNVQSNTNVDPSEFRIMIPPDTKAVQN